SKVKQQLQKFSRVKDAVLLQRMFSSFLALFESEKWEMDAGKVLDIVYPEEETIGAMLTIPERDFFAARLEEQRENIDKWKRELSPYFSPLSMNYEKLLFVDLTRVVVAKERFSPSLLHLFGEQSLSEYREIAGRFGAVLLVLKNLAEELFHDHTFEAWRAAEFKEYLAQKRREEKADKRKYTRSYLEYLDEKEREMFALFWEHEKWTLLLAFLKGEGELPGYSDTLKLWQRELTQGAYPALEWTRNYRIFCALLEDMDTSILPNYLATIRTFQQLDQPLLGKYRGLRHEKRGQLEKNLAAAFYPQYGYGTARSHAFRQAAVIGSLFKLVPAYEALRQTYMKALEKGKSTWEINPLVIIDDKHKTCGTGGGGMSVSLSMGDRSLSIIGEGGCLAQNTRVWVEWICRVR
ncbi:MAG: hypothetical protein ACKVOH_06145, partial [Chlamydiales bacterium]